MAMVTKGVYIGAGCIHHGGELLGVGGVLMIEIELLPIPLWSENPLKNRNVGRVAAGSRIQTVPAEFASPGQAWIKALPGSRVDRAGIDLLNRLHLRRGHAILLAVAFALERSGVEMTFLGIGDHPVLHPVESVACIDYRLREQRSSGCGQVGCRGSLVGGKVPQDADVNPGAVLRRGSAYNAI